jgi:hypothetical protein
MVLFGVGVELRDFVPIHVLPQSLEERMLPNRVPNTVDDL